MTRRSTSSSASPRLYYSIGETARMVGVNPSVLRFWETEFPFLKPRKSKTGNRVYRPTDIKRVMLVKRLLHEDGYTIAGARKRLAQEGEAEQAELWCEAATEREILDSIRTDVSALRRILEKADFGSSADADES